MLIERLKTGVADFLQAELVKELVSQGHEATGKLKESIEVSVRKSIDNVSIRGEFAFYGEYVDRGRKAGGKKVPIDVLIEWIRVKKLSLNGKREKDVAFAIQNSIHKKGIPTDGDRRKKRFVSRTLDKHENEIIARVDEIVSGFMFVQFNNLIERSQKEFDILTKRAA